MNTTTATVRGTNKAHGFKAGDRFTYYGRTAEAWTEGVEAEVRDAGHGLSFHRMDNGRTLGISPNTKFWVVPAEATKPTLSDRVDDEVYEDEAAEPRYHVAYSARQNEWYISDNAGECVSGTFNTEFEAEDALVREF